MKRKECDNRSPSSLGTVCWLPLFGVEALAFEPMHPSLQKSYYCPFEVKRFPSHNQNILHKLLRPCH